MKRKNRQSINKVIIGIGSNIDPEKNIQSACQKLKSKFIVKKCSAFVLTPSLGNKNLPPFKNGAVFIETVLTQSDLKAELQSIEESLGRGKLTDPYASRTIDLDIVVWNGTIVHADYYERPFLRNAIGEIADTRFRDPEDSEDVLSVESIIGIARKAAAIVLDYYKDDTSFDLKADKSPVTEADRASEEFLRRKLRDLKFRCPIISEETAPPDYVLRREWKYFWLVDPLDGTKGFIKKDDEFAVSIALVKDREPIIGVIAVPASGRIYYAQKGKGAYCLNRDGKTKRITHAMLKPDQALRVVTSRYHEADRLPEYLRSVNVAEHKKVGSALKFCLMAEGEADLYPRLSPAMEWDVAAGDCIYRNASVAGICDTGIKYNTPHLKIEKFIFKHKVSG